MRKILAGLFFMALAGTLSIAATPQDQDDRHDNGKHKGWYKHGDHEDYQGWDDDHDRIRPGHAYPYGRYDHVRAEFIARRIDFRTRRVVLYDNSNWVVANYDLDRCRDWE